MRRKCQVILLPTKKEINKDSIVLSNITRTLDIFDRDNIGYNTNTRLQTPHHLYILSDEEIKEGDIRLDYFMKDPKPIISDKNYSSTWTKKIIATTNPELYTKENGLNSEKYETNIPKISQDFIEAYIKEYNAGNPIKEVMVEYEEKCIGCGAYPAQGMKYCTYPVPDEHQRTLTNSIKLRSDNTIIISIVKEKMYSRKELKNAIINCLENCEKERIITASYNERYKQTEIELDEENFDEWFNKNYPE